MRGEYLFSGFVVAYAVRQHVSVQSSGPKAVPWFAACHYPLILC